jgi:predicted small lipoprotein YifL
MKIAPLLLLLALALPLAGCGTKNDLLKPDGKSTPSSQQDPSKPPSPIGQ